LVGPVKVMAGLVQLEFPDPLGLHEGAEAAGRVY
jgi:hypothetical protein